MISFPEGLGALEFQMLVYKKVYQGLSINNKGSSPLDLFGSFGVCQRENPAQQPHRISS